MTRPSLHELAQMQARAEYKYPIGSHIRHQKGNNIYEIVLISTAEANAEVLVSFRPIDKGEPQLQRVGDYPVHGQPAITRPLAEIEEIVTWHDREMQQRGRRFVRCAKVEQWIDV